MMALPEGLAALDLNMSFTKYSQVMQPALFDAMIPIVGDKLQKPHATPFVGLSSQAR